MSDIFLTQEELDAYILGLDGEQRQYIRVLLLRLAPSFIGPDRPTQTSYHKLLNAVVHLHQQMRHLHLME